MVKKGDKYEKLADEILSKVLRIQGENVYERQMIIIAALIERFCIYGE